MYFYRILLAVTFLTLAASTLCSGQEKLTGLVVDDRSGRPLAGASVTCGKTVVASDAHGRFSVEGCGNNVLLVRAPGYGRSNAGPANPLVVRLKPVTPKALYLSVYGIGSRQLRERALSLMGARGLNALVIDLKGDRGLVPFPSSSPIASRIGARKVTTIRDLRETLKSLKAKGLYLIARIVVFKDNPLSRSHPELAVKDSRGRVWSDREGLAWSDPFRKEVWDYNLALAEEAARSGFDEIQFDYVRFPDAGGLVFSRPNTEANRIEAITGFLKAARERLKPFNVFLAADVFGYICWNLNDTKIGQRLEDIAPLVDYTCPMLYPSGFQFGIPGYRVPVQHPYEIVLLSLQRAIKRTGLPGSRFRPWLQSFRDYAFDRRRFGVDAVAAQIRAAEKLGTNGWMLWNPRNAYDSVRQQRKPAKGFIPMTAR